MSTTFTAAGRLARNPHVGYAVFGAALMTLPVLAGSGLMMTSTLMTVGFTLIYAIVAMGLNLLLGYSGLISLGTAGFMGLGAYLAAYVQDDLGLGFWVAVLAALVIPTVIGILVGVVSLRVRSIYLAIATLTISEILLKTFEQAEWFTHGTAGKQSHYPVILGVQADRALVFGIIVVALVLVMMLTHNIVHGQLGRALHAMRASEVAAQAMGVNVLTYKLFAFAVATLYAGLAGALYLFFLKSSYPSTWNLFLSLNVVAMVVVGGLRSIYGTVVGAFVIFAVPELVLKRLPVIGDVAGLPYIFSGVLIIVVIMFFPQGLRGVWDVGRRMASTRRPVSAPVDAARDEVAAR
ncbi:branched-chain amino acid ABC transporter permease [Isoptericola sp. b441]|uniref:Branched-chain amino acid ABC transporter permease n=1 Tax=Actinotalea lenta TaxID=3064654 RepID=A0ABT9D9N9_9CELL|nr:MULTISPECIES: branched-chain amino acid ABC transporter permease [unclassified Isoptericola]MDO8107596.1 branched-chain amino acid ABC transporter permease [Isoptericola sp. b441]MDO8120744.1 branched-chain amino acid ABC transporter permease [Isoptericola sp. b490]